MLTLRIEPMEMFDNRKQEFITTRGAEIVLEHSLVSLSKWESKWCKPFLSTDKKTTAETIDYIRCMTITQKVNPDVYLFLSDEHIDEVKRYIDAPMTATTINRTEGSPRKKAVITSEVIYYQMIALNIPFECQKWHLNRLLTLINVVDIKNSPPKKMGRGTVLRNNAALNEARKRKLKTRG